MFQKIRILWCTQKFSSELFSSTVAGKHFHNLGSVAGGVGDADRRNAGDKVRGEHVDGSVAGGGVANSGDITTQIDFTDAPILVFAVVGDRPETTFFESQELRIEIITFNVFVTKSILSNYENKKKCSPIFSSTWYWHNADNCQYGPWCRHHLDRPLQGLCRRLTRRSQ